jgi:hypothetical protein
MVMFNPRRRDDRHQPWFGTMVGVGAKSPWFDERRATWEHVPTAAEPIIRKPPRRIWRRLIRFWRG